MHGANATDRGACAVALNAEGGAPGEIMLLPAGRIVGLDGRAFANDAPDAVVAAFAAAGFDLPVDLEHATELKGPKGEPAPAHGWIKQLLNRAGAIHARVEWTEDGARLIAQKPTATSRRRSCTIAAARAAPTCLTAAGTHTPATAARRGARRRPARG